MTDCDVIARHRSSENRAAPNLDSKRNITRKKYNVFGCLVQALHKLLDIFKGGQPEAKPKLDRDGESASGETREERDYLVKQIVSYWEANVRAYTQKAKTLSAFNVVQIATPNQDHTLLGPEASLRIRQAKILISGDGASEPSSSSSSTFVSVQQLYATILDAYVDFAEKDRIVAALDKGNPEVLIGVRLAADLILSVSVEEILSRMPLAEVKSTFAVAEVEAMLVDKYNLKPGEKVMVNVCAVGLHKIEREYFDEWVAALGQRNISENARVLYNVIGVAPHGSTFALTQFKKGDRVTARNIRVMESISADEWQARFQVKLQPAHMYTYQNPTYSQPTVVSSSSNSSWREARHIHTDEAVDYGGSHRRHHQHHPYAEGSHAKRRPADDNTHVEEESRRRSAIGPQMYQHQTASHRRGHHPLGGSDSDDPEYHINENYMPQHYLEG